MSIRYCRPLGWARLSALAVSVAVFSGAALAPRTAEACEPDYDDRTGRVVGVGDDGLVLYRLDVFSPDNIRPEERLELQLIGADGRLRATITCREPCNGHWDFSEADQRLPERVSRSLVDLPSRQTSFDQLEVDVARVIGATPLRPSTRPFAVRSDPKSGLCASIEVLDPEGPLPIFQIEDTACEKAEVKLFEHPRSGYLFLRISYANKRLTVADDRWIDASVLEGARLAKRAEKARREQRSAQAIALSKQALALVPESDEARWTLAQAMADAGYAWISVKAELNIAYPPSHTCSLIEGPAGFYSWLSKRSPWADEAATDPWLTTMLDRHRETHDDADPTQLLNPPLPRLTRPEVMVEDPPVPEPPAPPAVTPPPPPREMDAAHEAEAPGLRFHLAGYPVTFDLGTLLLVGAHLVVLGGYTILKRRSRE